MSTQFPDRSYKLVDLQNAEMEPNWYDYFYRQGYTLNLGISVVITTAKLTGGGANGSMTFTNGILTAQTQAT